MPKTRYVKNFLARFLFFQNLCYLAWLHNLPSLQPVREVMMIVISNKCFIHSPAEDKPKIIVFWLYWQQDFKVWIYRGGVVTKFRFGQQPVKM